MDHFIFKINRRGVGKGGGRGRCTEHNFTFVVSYYTLRCNMQFLNVFISSQLLLSSFLNRLSFLWSKLWCCYCNSVIHTLILCKIWQYEIKHLMSQICTFTGCMSDHLLSLSTTQLLNMYGMPHRTILALFFFEIFQKDGRMWGIQTNDT